MKLVAISTDGQLAEPIERWPDFVQHVIAATLNQYAKAGCKAPWLGYLAVEADQCIGTCAFKTPPVDERVEIAYFTFPGNEGRGVATEMARQLIEMARTTQPTICIYAQTLPEMSASTRVLEKLDFRFTTEVNHPEDGSVWEWELFDNK